MVPLYRLDRLPFGQRRRKLALSFATLERQILAGSGDLEYLWGLVKLALEDSSIDPVHRDELSALVSGPPENRDPLRVCNHARHALLGAIGTFPAEWDLVVPAGLAAVVDGPRTARPFFPGVCVYAEDIRSPFNLGSIFRTAEAFGAERLYASPLCAPMDHPRAVRSSMGTQDYLPHSVSSLDDLPGDLPVFALETGGTPLEDFEFPERGIVIIGSEELGVSPEGLKKAAYGRVTIPMYGLKASLNVGVAFGILMERWTSYLDCSASKPF
ncbi:MAG: TrmH family RNA methyltransferase [Spirochaetales bacterium]|nr:TrmH family RNA methyltransferase [Spirochaetales bacterium]